MFGGSCLLHFLITVRLHGLAVSVRDSCFKFMPIADLAGTLSLLERIPELFIKICCGFRLEGSLACLNAGKWMVFNKFFSSQQHRNISIAVYSPSHFFRS